MSIKYTIIYNTLMYNSPFINSNHYSQLVIHRTAAHRRTPTHTDEHGKINNILL